VKVAGLEFGRCRCGELGVKGVWEVFHAHEREHESEVQGLREARMQINGTHNSER
jgi:hypothetical protein